MSYGWGGFAWWNVTSDRHTTWRQTVTRRDVRPSRESCASGIYFYFLICSLSRLLCRVCSGFSLAAVLDHVATRTDNNVRLQCLKNRKPLQGSPKFLPLLNRILHCLPLTFDAVSMNNVTIYKEKIMGSGGRSPLTHCGRVTQICVFNTVKLSTSASSP